MSDLISRQAAISAICNACGKIDCDKMDKCEKLQLPPANCSEFPNNSDMISRQAAIDALDGEITVTGRVNAEAVRGYANLVCDRIKRLPSAHPEQRWIPCGERLPEADERVLVTTGSYDYYVWDCMSNRSDNYFWEDESGFYHDKHEVIAWMPLPEPYKGGEQDG